MAGIPTTPFMQASLHEVARKTASERGDGASPARAHERVVPPGGIAWNEYASPDVGRSREFLCGLFGWTARRKEFGHEGAYETFVFNGRDVAGLLSVSDLEGGSGRAGWYPVFRVQHVDLMAAKACELGATLVCQPSGIAGLGRHAMLAGPSQGRMALLDGLDGRVPLGVGCVTWNELRVSRPSATGLFLWQTFGWNSESYLDDRDGMVVTFRVGDDRVASMRKSRGDESSRCLPCVQVGDVTSTLRRARELGGVLAEERVDDPVLGHYARLVDPLGVDLMVWRAAS